jgi:hypothetical protein
VIAEMHLTVRQTCFKLDTVVFIIGLVMMMIYLVVGVGGVVWFVTSYSDESEMVMKKTDFYNMKLKSMRSSLILMTMIMVISLVGLVTCLLLVMGVKTGQVQLFLPWQVYHAVIILACFVGGFYQAMHYTVLAEREDTFKACLSLFPVVAGIFGVFFWVFVNQLFSRMKNKRQRATVMEEKRATLACLHGSLPRQKHGEAEKTPYRSVKSIRTLKRKKAGFDLEFDSMRMRSRSMEHFETDSKVGAMGSQDYWISNRSRSLPRNMEQSGSRYSGREY